MNRRVQNGLRLAACCAALLVGADAWAQTREIVLSGRIVDSEGEPVDTAVVELLAPLSPYQDRLLVWKGERSEPVATARPGRDGEFELEVPSPGPWKGVVRADGYAEQDLTQQPFLLESRRLAEIELSRSKDVTVEVVGPEGEPVAGAWIRAGSNVRPSMRLRRFTGSSHRATSDEQGLATIQVPEGGTLHYVHATHPDLGHAHVDSPDGSRVRVELAGGTRRELRVVDRSGRAVAEAIVTLGSQLPRGLTNDDGRTSVVLTDNDRFVAARSADGLVGSMTRSTADEKPGLIELTIEPHRSMTVEILDSGTRTPVEGAWAHAQDPSRAVTTDARGVAELSVQPPTEGDEDAAELRILASALGYFDGNAEAEIGADNKLLLKAGVTVRGRVVDSQGQLLDDVLVEVGPGGRSSYFRLDQKRYTKTGRDGRFELAPFDAAEGLTLTARRAGFARAQVDLAAPPEGRDPSEVTVELTAGRSAWGTVVDESDAPIAGAEVTLLEQSAESGIDALIAQRLGQQDAPKAYTDAEGRFTFEDLATGRYDLAAKASGFAPAQIPAIELSGSARQIEVGTVALSPGVELEGRIVDSGGLPIPGAEVRAEVAGSGFMSFSFSMGDEEPDAVTDADGRFTVFDLADGASVNLTVKADGYGGAARNGARAPSAEPVVIELQPAVTVTGVIVDENGEGLTSARVSFNAEQRGSPADFRAMINRRHNESTDDEGRFTLDDVVPGKYRLVASAKNYQEGELTGIDVEVGGDNQLRLQLQRGAVLTGTVTDANGRPLAEAAVQRVEKQQNFLRMTPGRFKRATTNADGEFELDGLAPGRSSYKATHKDHQEQTLDIELAATGGRLDFRLDEGLEISGRVIGPNGIAIGGARVSAQPPAGAVIVSFGSRDNQVATKEDGSFTLRGLSNGTYKVTAQKSGFASASTEDDVRLEGSSAFGVEIVLGTGAAVVGTITGLEFDDLSSVQIFAMQAGASSVEPVLGKATYEGEYRLDSLTAGNWTVMASVGNSGRMVRQSVTIDPGVQEVVLDIDFGGGFVVTGQVVGADGPQPGVTVWASGKSKGSVASGTTDGDGRFTLEGLEADTYDIATMGASAQQKEVVVEGDTEVLIELKSFNLSGRVLSAAGEPVQAAAISVTSLSPGDVGGFFRLGEPPLTDASGFFVLDGVQPGSYRVQAEKEGWSAAHTDVNVEETDVGGLEITMQRGGGLRFTVVTPGGSAVTSISAVAVDANDNPVTSGSFQAGEEGFHIEALPPGEWRLHVQAAGSAALAVDVTVPSEGLQIVLPRGGALQVRVPELMGTSTLGKLRIRDANGRPYMVPSFLNLTREWSILDGQVTTPPLPEGVWTLEVESGDGERTWSATTQVVAETVLEVSLQ